MTASLSRDGDWECFVKRVASFGGACWDFLKSMFITFCVAFGSNKNAIIFNEIDYIH